MSHLSEENPVIEEECEVFTEEGGIRVDQWQDQIRRAVDAALMHHFSQIDKALGTDLDEPIQLYSPVQRQGKNIKGAIDLYELGQDEFSDRVIDFEKIFPIGRGVKVFGKREDTEEYGRRGEMSVAEKAKSDSHGFVRSGTVKNMEAQTNPPYIEVELEKGEKVEDYDDVSVLPDSSKDRTHEKVFSLLKDLITKKREEEGGEIHFSPPMRQFLDGSFPIVPEGDLEKKGGLDDSQNEAYGRAMLYEKYPVLFIHGGPGTGKTHTTTEIIAGHIKKGRKVLLLSHSNKGAQVPALHLQQVMDKRQARAKTYIAGNLPEKVDPRLQTCRMKRGMPPYPKEKLQEINRLTLAQAIQRYCGSRFDTWDFNAALRDIGGKHAVRKFQKQEKEKILASYQEALQKKTEKLKSKFEKGGLVVSTFGTLISDEILSQIEFDVVMVDEATRMRMPELILALERAGKQIIFIGDPVQLGNIPITPEEFETVKEELQTPVPSVVSDVSRFVNHVLYKDEAEAERAVKEMEDGPFTVAINESNDPEKELPYVFLNQNRRSLPNIVHVLSELMYKGKLQPGREPLPDGNEGVVRWHDTKHLETTESTKGTSKKNSQEAQLIAKRILDKIKGQGVPPEDIGVIATYASQAHLIRSYLKRVLYYGSPENRELYERMEPNISTVDAFQGDQRKIVFVSLTRSNEAGDIGFLEEERRIGVAVGRAEDELHIFGDSDTVVENNNNPDSADFFGKLKGLVEQYGERVELPARKGKKK